MFSLFNKRKFRTINVNDIKPLLGKIELIDIREKYEYANGHLPSTKNIPMEELLSNAEKYLDNNRDYYIICQSGGRSSKACTELTNVGYKVINVSGGTGSYVGALER